MGVCCSKASYDIPLAEAQIIPQGNNGQTVVTGGNSKLVNFSAYEWTSDSPMTRKFIIEEREKFWDTQPSYSGRIEIWQTLRLACESGDRNTAQAIIDSANITVPTGKLTDGCYDELGNQYIVPNYCILEPTNIQEDDNIVPEAVNETENLMHVKTVSGIASPVSPTEKIQGPFSVTFRLSTGKDIVFDIQSEDTISHVKSVLLEKCPELQDGKIRLLFLGKVLEDNLYVYETKIKPKIIVQVMFQCNV